MPDDLKDRFVALMEEVFNRGNYEAARPWVADDFFNHGSPDSTGPEGFTATARWLRSAFPDYHAELHEFPIDGDLLAARLIVSGTHAGDFMGAAPTGRSFWVQHMYMYRVRDGKLVEHWACRDDLGQLRQLGLLPGTRGGDSTDDPYPDR